MHAVSCWGLAIIAARCIVYRHNKRSNFTLAQYKFFFPDESRRSFRLPPVFRRKQGTHITGTGVDRANSSVLSTCGYRNPTTCFTLHDMLVPKRYVFTMCFQFHGKFMLRFQKLLQNLRNFRFRKACKRFLDFRLQRRGKGIFTTTTPPGLNRG